MARKWKLTSKKPSRVTNVRRHLLSDQWNWPSNARHLLLRQPKQNSSETLTRSNLSYCKAQLQQTNLTEEPDWSALKNEGYSTDDIFFAKTEWDKQQKQAYEVAAERQRIAQQQAQEHEAHLKQHLTNQRVEMLERIPEWRNDETREFERKEVIKYAQKRVGFSEEEISSASDARAIELLYKAWKWDNLMEKKPTTKKAHSPSTEDGQGRATGNQARSC